MPNTDATLWEKRRERARRWAQHDLDGYPAVPLAEETDATLAAEPPERTEKKRKAAQSRAE
jgi:hypothetical protein